MSTKLLVDESKYQQLRRDLRYSGLRYIKFWFISMIVNSLAALNFYFIEHCFTAVQRLPTVSENLFQSACDLVNEYRQYNESITLLENKLNKLCEQEIGRMLSARTRKCQLSNLVFAEWFDYAYVVSLTIGYGNTVPFSDLGKVATIVLAVPLMGMAATTLIYAGEIIVIITKIIMVKFERIMFRRKVVKVCCKKVCVVQCFLALLNWAILAALYVKGNRSDSISIIDAIYFVFITMTTIGFGDFAFTNEWRVNSPVISVVTLLMTNFAMATIASLLTSVSDIIKSFRFNQLKDIGSSIRHGRLRGAKRNPKENEEE